MITSVILCWGDIGWDDYEGEDAPRPGGCALNVARSLALAGVQVEVAGPVGADGRPLVDLLDSWGVGTEGVEVVAGATPRQRIRLLEGGERSLCGHSAGALGHYVPGETTRARLAAADLVYVPVWETTLPWLDVLWSVRQGPVALDLMDLEDVEVALLPGLIQRAWATFAGLSDEHPALLTLRDAARSGEGLVVATLGAQGGIAYQGEQAIAWAAVPLPGALIDTTGCGDAFAGAFLAALKDVWGERPATVESLREPLAAAAFRAAQVACHRGAVRVG